jgi:fumarate reductase flavoprotein subunit
VSHDLIVIGGGLAGLAAANRAAELGLCPVVLEQGGDPQYFCNSRFAGGLLHVAFKDMRAAPDDILAAIEAQTGGDDATLNAAVMAREAERALAWIRAQGAKFIKGGSLEFMRWVMAPPRPRTAGLDWKGRGPDVTLRRMSARLNEHGGVVRLATRARDLIMEDGVAIGVVAECNGVVERLAAPAMVIADGGFQANMALMRQFISPRPESLLQRGAATGRGDGLTMAQAAGARLIGMDRFYGHLLGREALHNDRLWPYPILDAIAVVGLVVNDAGYRFLDEGMGGVYMANAVARLDDPLSAIVVFDDAIWTGVAADNRYPPCMNPVFVKAGGTVIEADDLGVLAERIGVPADALRHTVAAHNAAVRDNTGAHLSPPRATDRFQPHAIETPPFRAILACAGITYTMGGVAIDEDSRVLHRDGGVITGLYAVGSASGGIEGGPRAAYLGGLAKAVITGLRAAEAIAADRLGGETQSK